MTLVEVLTIVFASAGTLIGVYTFAGRKWKGEYELEHTRAERLEATLVEKDKIVEGQSDRLGRLDSLVQELGGRRVYEAVMEQQKDIAKLFGQIAEQLSANAARSSTEHEQIVGLIQTVGVELHQLANGKE